MTWRLRRLWCGLTRGHTPRNMLSLGEVWGTGPARYRCVHCGHEGGYKRTGARA